MALASVLSPAIGFLVYVISTLPVEAHHQNLSDQKLPVFLKKLGFSSPSDSLIQRAETFEDDAPLKHVDSDKRLWPSVMEIVKSMEEDRMTKAVVSDVILGRYQRSPPKPTFEPNQGNNRMSQGMRRRKQGRPGRAAQMPPEIPTGMPTGMPDGMISGMPDMPIPPT